MSRLRDEGSGPGRRRHEIVVVGFRVACGEFIGISDVCKDQLEKPGTALLPRHILYAPAMFVARGLGGSMLPTIQDGWWLFFHRTVVGTRQNRYVLVEDQSQMSGPRYTLKKYHSTKIYNADGTWVHSEIRLESLNPAHPDIILEKGGTYGIRGWYVGCASYLERVEPIQYPDAAGE